MLKLENKNPQLKELRLSNPPVSKISSFMHRYTLQQEEICQKNHHHAETNIIKEIEGKIPDDVRDS